MGHPPRPRLVLVVTLAEVGGAGTYVGMLASGMRHSFEVTIAAHGPGPLRDLAEREGIRYVPLAHVRRPVSPWRDARGLIELARLFRRERPHIVHANSSKAGILARLAAALARVPIRVFTVHGWAFSTQRGAAAAVYLWSERLCARLSSLVICVSESDRELGTRARTCRAGRSLVIPNAVDVACAPRARPGRGGVPMLVSVGRLQAPQKDFLTLVRALSRLPEGSFQARLVGDGPDRTAIGSEIHSLGLDGRVELLGERADVADLLAASDVFVLATTYESLPMSIIEAMAAGLPVVASHVGGVPELVVHGETGFLVPPQDPDALACALRPLLEDAELRARLGAAALERARAHFDLEPFWRAHAEAYGGLLAQRGLPAPAAAR